MNFYPERLAPDRRLAGQRRLRLFFSLNGITVACLMDSVLILYAIRNGVSDALIAVIVSFIQLTMPLTVLGYRMVGRRGLAGTWSLCWALRSVFAALMVFAPQVGLMAGSWAAAAVIVVGAFGFASFKAIGMVTHMPLIGEITSANERGSFVSSVYFRDQLSYLLGTVGILLLLGVSERVAVYQAIIVVGSACGIVASRVLRAVPETSVPSRSARMPLWETLQRTVSNRDYRRMLWGWMAGIAAYSVVVPIATVAVKNGYLISDQLAMVYGVLVVVGGVLAAAAGTVLSDQVGPRPLLLLYAGLLLGVGLFWGWAPESAPLLIVGITFFAAGFAKVGIIIGTNHYLLAMSPETERVGISLVVRIVSGAFAGLVGSLGAGLLLDYLSGSGLHGLSLYRQFFRTLLPLLLVGVMVVYRMKRLDEWPLPRLLRLLFSWRDLRTLLLVNRSRRSQSFSKDIETAKALAVSRSPLSERTLREFLQSPRLALRYYALQALKAVPYGPETALLVRHELSDGEFTTAWIAAEVLGLRNDRHAIDQLRSALTSRDVFLQGKAMVALARMQDQESRGPTLGTLRATPNPRLVVQAAEALTLYANTDDSVELLARSVDPALPVQCRDEVLAAAAVLLGVEVWFHGFLARVRRGESRAEEELYDLLASMGGQTDATGLTASNAEADTVPATWIAAHIEPFVKQTLHCRAARALTEGEGPVPAHSVLVLLAAVVAMDRPSEPPLALP